MFNTSRVSVVAALFAFASTSVYASAEFVPKTVGNVENGKTIYTNGKESTGVPACLTCHGEKALGEKASGE